MTLCTVDDGIFKSLQFYIEKFFSEIAHNMYELIVTVV